MKRFISIILISAILFTTIGAYANVNENQYGVFSEEEPYNEEDYIFPIPHTPQERIPISERYPAEPAKIFGYDYIDNTEYDEDSDSETMELFTAPSPYITAAASATNIISEPTYAMSSGFGEYISPYSGEMSLKFDDINLTGRNGMDFNIGRLYQTNQAILGNKYINPDTLIENFDYSTYLQDRYALGTGWSFAFPSVEVHGDPDGDPELYYHTGNGNVYKVNHGATSSNLENYYATNLKFMYDPFGTSNPNLYGIRYYVQCIDGTRQYFAKDGRLLAIDDRFNNRTRFYYTARPVSNIVPNGLFSYPENIGLWTMSGPRIGYDDGTILFNSSVTNTSDATSTYIEVEPNTEYMMSAWVYFAPELSKQYRGTVKISAATYKANKTTSAGTHNLYQSAEDAPPGGWHKIQGSFITSEETKYIKLKLENQSARGEMRFDNVCIDKARPLISAIVDDTGRRADFDYGKYLYDRDASDVEDLTVTISAGGSAQRTLTYSRYRFPCQWTKDTPTGSYQEDTYFWTLDAYCENDILRQEFEYGHDGVASHEYFSFLHDAYSSGHSFTTYRPLITALYINNTRIKYNYEKTTKWLGDFGYYQTNRVKGKRLNYKIGNTWNTAAHNTTTLNYQRNNETAYPNYYDEYWEFDTKVTDDSGLTTQYFFEGNKLQSTTVEDISTGEKITEEYDYDIILKDMPTEIYTTVEKTDFPTKEFYRLFNYTDWGGISSSTLPMTPTERANSSQRERLTTTYLYYKSTQGGYVVTDIPQTITWYTDFDKAPVSQKTMFDSMGRVITITNAKGEVTEYDYEDSEYAWLPFSITVRDVNNSHNVMDIKYHAQYYWWKGIYPDYIEEFGENDEYKGRAYGYNLLYDVLIRTIDEASARTFFYYDELGRIQQIRYPFVHGKNDNLFVLEEYSYSMSVPTTQYGNRNLHRTRVETVLHYDPYYEDTGEVFRYTEHYHDDYGNIALNRARRQGGSFIEEKYEYDTALRLQKHTDLNGKHVTYGYDKLGRNTSLSDMAGNTSHIKYGTNTVETYFVPNGTTTQENHTLQTTDIRGRTVSSSIYPNGISATPITQSYTYDIMGNVKSFKDGKNQTTTYFYNETGQLINTKYSGTTAEQFNTVAYGKNGSPTFAKQYDDGNMHGTAFIYNAYHQPVYRQDYSTGSETLSESYEHTPTGQLSSKFDRNGDHSTYLYDRSKNLITSTTTDDTINLYYSKFGNVSDYDYTDRSTLTKGNDDLGRINSRTEEGFDTDYIYDNAGKLTSQIDPFNLQTEYFYNDLNRLDYLTADGRTYDYDYYPDGMVKKLTYPNTNTNITTEYTYDNANRVKTVITKRASTTVLASYTYTYDNNSNIETVKDKNDQTTTYHYDGQNRLTEAIYPSKTVVYEYDAFGNRKTETVNGSSEPLTYNGINRLENDGENTYTYDRNGNTLTKSDGTSYTYNKRNKLISSAKNSVTTDYTYNAEGLRTAKNDTQYHLNEAGKVIAESENGSVTAQTVWSNQPLARKVSDNWYYYIYNAHGDVVMVLDESGNIQNTYEYDAWGNIEYQTENVDNPIKFAGEYLDHETGLYYLRNRYYDPKLGRFTQEDGIRDGDNWYVYCFNNPVMLVDRNGYMAAPAAQALICAEPYMQHIANISKNLGIQALQFAQMYGNQVVEHVAAYGYIVWEKISGPDADYQSSSSTSGSSGSGPMGPPPPNLNDRISLITASAETIRQTYEKYGVKNYHYLRDVLQNTGLQAHHIIEQRFAGKLGLDPKFMKSIAVTPEQHQLFTNAWRSAIGYANDKTQFVTSTAGRTEIYNTARKIYMDFPEILEIIHNAMKITNTPFID